MSILDAYIKCYGKIFGTHYFNKDFDNNALKDKRWLLEERARLDNLEGN